MRARAVLVVVFGAAYVAATHWLMTRAPVSAWNAVLVVGPMLALAAFVSWQRKLRLLALVAAAATVGLVVQAWRGGGLSAEALYVAQHVVVHLILAFMFGATLQAGREPLIAMLARRVHARTTAAMADYARNVTLAWTMYFVAMAVLSLLIFAAAPFAWWAVFANLLTPLAMAALFVGEFALRYRLHPEFERATLAQAMAAYSQRSTAVEPPLPRHD